MAPIKAAILREAWVTLGVPQDSELSVSKSAYRKLALKAHPDKNDGSAASTLEFQRLADAYQILTQYDENPTGARVASNYEPEDDGFESDDEGFGSGMHSDEFYQFMFENLFASGAFAQGGMPGMPGMNGAFRVGGQHFFMGGSGGGGGGGYGGGYGGGSGRQQSFNQGYEPPPETAAAYSERRARERATKAQAVHELEAKERKEREERERVKDLEMKQGAIRREAKNQERKIRAEQERVDGIKRAKDRLRAGQTKRSEAFAKARARDSQGVRDLIWNDSVGCGDVEFLPSFIVAEDESQPITPIVPTTKPKGKKGKKAATANVKEVPVNVKIEDRTETLLHIAAKNDDPELVEWLMNHGATSEERNSNGLTAFHSALSVGSSKVVEWFIESAPPAVPAPKFVGLDHYDAYYPLPPGKTLLSLAVSSEKAEMVQLISKYSNNIQDAAANWEFVEGVQEKVVDDDKKYQNWDAVKWALADIISPPEPTGGRR